MWTGRRGVAVACAVSALGVWLAGSSVQAQVKMRVRPDGSLEIYNDAPSRPLSGRPLKLAAVPRADWDDWIREHADRHGVDPRLVQAIVQVESGYNHRAVSHKGAVGLMQLMPATAKNLEVVNRYSPEQNIRGGVAYLRKMIDLFPGQLELAIAAYNAGPTAVQKHHAVPPFRETREYVDRVLTLYRGSSGMISFSGGGVPPRLNGLAQSFASSPLQQAVAGGLLRQPAAPATAPAGETATLARAAAPAPSPARAQPAAAPAPAQPVGVVPASLPIAAEPAPAQPATGG